MDAILERSRELKQALVDFVLDAEGELAAALETYVATHSRTTSKQRYDASYQQKLLIDSFLTEGNVGEKSPLDLFIEEADLTESDRQLLNRWHNSFMGLFAVTEIIPDGFLLTNWLSQKSYTVKPNDPQTLEDMKRFKDGEILLTRITPVTDEYYMFSGPCIPMGAMGKPKLAVAIGNFKEDHKKNLYADAPELLEKAWESVAEYHQEFLDFFGSEEITLSGYHLNKKIAEFQEVMSKKRLEAAGIDESKSLSELAQEAGMTEEEMALAAEEAGADAKEVTKLFDSKNPAKMVMPKIDLPDNLKKAEQITAITHPRWGQMFLPTYSKFKSFLEAADWKSIEGGDKLVQKHLEDPAINAFIWHRLAQAYPTQLEKVLQEVLARPNFKLNQDLDSLLQEYNKPIEPDLPEIASVPLHLHNLFQDALLEVNKSKNKGKKKPQSSRGFK